MELHDIKVKVCMQAAQHHASTASPALHTHSRHNQLHTTATPWCLGDCYEVGWCAGCLCEERGEFTHTMSGHATIHAHTRAPKVQPCTCLRTLCHSHVSVQPCVHLEWCLPAHGTTMVGVRARTRSSVIGSVLILMQWTEIWGVLTRELPHTHTCTPSLCLGLVFM